MKRILGIVGLTSAASLVALLAATPAQADEEFSYLPPGDLAPGSGSGRDDSTVYAPGMRFPIENGPAYPNSQVWGYGGGSGPGGGQCDEANYDYPWRDNYCESRSWDMPLCPSGNGHQGQDIRPGTCDDRTHWIVASEAGTVTNVGSYSVYVTTDSGQRFDYLHGKDVSVSSGQAVEKGQRLATVSNAFGGTPTTIHLHYNIKQDVSGVGFVYVSPYMSLVRSYEELMGFGTEPPYGPVDSIDCEAVRGWAQDPDQPDGAVNVEVFFDGPAGDPQAVGVEITADEHREDLCDSLGSCEHGFSLEVPRSLQDGEAHSVFVYAVDGDGGEKPELDTSPVEMRCTTPAIPSGVRRALSGAEAIADWEVSPFWDATPLGSGALDDIAEGEPWPMRRTVIQAEGDSDWWMLDQGRRRLVSQDVAEVWGIDAGEVETRPSDTVFNTPLGPPLRADKFLVSADGVTLYVVDEDVCPADEDCGDDGAASTSAGGTDGDDSDSGSSGETSGPDPLPATDEEGDDGCGCSMQGGPARGWLWMPLIAFSFTFSFRRRRRRRRR